MSEIFSIIDLETTGPSHNHNRIMEIAIIQVQDNKVVRKFESLVNPEEPIPEFVSKLTGLYEEHVSKAPNFALLKDELFEMLQGTTIVAHNSKFDYGFLKSEFKRHNMEFSEKSLCTVQLSRKLFPEYKKHSLDSLITRFDFKCENRHRAMGDAEVLHEFLLLIQELFPPEKIEEAKGSLFKKYVLPPKISNFELETITEGPGVYIFEDKDGNALYVGKTSKTRSKLKKHFCNESYTSKEFFAEITNISCHPKPGKLGAVVMASKLISELKPRIIDRKRRFSGPNERWPYASPIMLSEYFYDDPSCGELFVIDNWKVIAHGSFEGDAYKIKAISHDNDKETFKLIKSYLRRSHTYKVKPISWSVVESLLS